MKKENKFRFLSVWLLLSMLFGISIQAWAAQSDVIESVTVEGTTFTITRSDASAATFVNYRTLDGSAVGGVHFEHQSGRLYFKKGELSKSVTVKEIAVNDNNLIYFYGNNGDRSYSFVAWNSFTDPLTVSKSVANSYTYTYHNNDSDKTKWLGNDFWWNDDYDVWQKCYLSDLVTSAEERYRKATKQDEWWYRFYITFRNVKRDNGWFNAWIYLNGAEVHHFEYEDAPTRDCRQPWWGNGELWEKCSSNRQFQLKWRAHGSGDDYAKVYDLYLHCSYRDQQKPVVKSVACNTQHTYSTGDYVYASLCFDEIVNFTQNQSSCTINTNIGTMEYVCGEGTNVLCFRKQLTGNDDVSGLNITGANFKVKDIAGNVQDGFSSKNNNFKYKATRVSALSVTAEKWKRDTKLSWSNEFTKNVDGLWHIYRYKTAEGPAEKNEDYAFSLLNNELGGSSTSYVDESDDMLYNTEYTYMLQYVPFTWNVKNLPLDRMIPCSTVLDTVFNIDLTVTSYEDHLSLNWDKSDKFNDTKAHEFIIYRKEGSQGKFVQIDKVGSSTTSYDDYNVSSGCATYYYKVSTEGLFADNNYPSGRIYSNDTTKASGQLSTESQVLSLEATKGTHAGTVKLTWNARQTGVDETKYVVYRRDLSSDDAWVKLHTTSGTSKVYSFDDNTALPGKYYEYKVASSYICSTTQQETDPVEVFDDGFCRALGVVSGRVTYGTGVAVKDAKVYVAKSQGDETEQFYSLRVGGYGSGLQLPLTVKQGTNYFNKPWSIQMYVNPDNAMTNAKGEKEKNIPLVEVYKNFGLYLNTKDDNSYSVYLAGPSADTVKKVRTALGIKANKFSHLTFSYNGSGQLTVRITDEYGKIKKDAKTFDAIKFVADNDTVATNSIFFGACAKDSNAFHGYLDEIRVFADKELTDDEILLNYNRTLSGSESKLVVYWPMDEGIKNQKRAYDYSKTSGVTNNNHGTILSGSSVSSQVVPTRDQLNVYGVTDGMGNYTINGIPFAGDGTTYMVTPTFGVHKFSPQYLTRFISATSLVHSGVDFEDVSAFKTTGVVYYYNTNYPVEGANIYVDGTICSKDGELITTGVDGEFTISVPIGDHHIQVKKQDHVFVDNGRFPSNALKEYTFDREMSDKLVFYDSTFVTLTGRVAGGYPESQKLHGFGQGNATIGKATIQLTAGDMYQLNLDSKSSREFSCPSDSVKSKTTTGKYDDGDNARVLTIHTDSVTGEFAVSVPPIDLKVKNVKVDNNPDIKFSTDDIENILLGTGSLRDQTDSLEVAPGDTVTFTYRYALDLIYRSEPILELTSKSTKDGAFGDEFYVYQDEATLAYDTIPLYSVDTLADGSLDIKYTFGYPMFTQGRTYNHEMYLYEQYENNDNDTIISKIPLVNAEVAVANNLGATTVAIESGEDEEGNPVSDGQIITTSSSELVVDSTGKVPYKFIATYPNIVEPYTLGMNINFVYEGTSYSWAENGKFAGIVSGALQTGSNFVTLGPDKVLFVLRDPPGSGSSAYLEEGQTITTSSKVTTEYNSEYSAKVTMKFGMAANIGTGFGVMVFSEAEAKADVNVGTEITHDNTHERSNSYKITTTQKISTSDASNYVGEDGDLYIGSSTNIITGKARKVALAKKDSDYEVSLVEVYTIGEEFNTQFKYTQNYIENVLIPNYQSLRDNKLIKVSQSEYKSDYPNKSQKSLFITNLDPENEKFGTPGSYLWIQPEDKSVESMDTVAYYNTQISLWETQILLNEAAKVKAIDSKANYNESEYNNAVQKFEEAKMLENTRYLLYDPYTQHHVKLDSAFWFNKKGGVVKYADYGTNKAMINNILDGFLINRSEYEKYLSTPSKERDFTLFYDTLKYGWKVKNLSFDSGSRIEESVQRCGSSSSTDASTTKGLAVAGVASGYTWNKFGMMVELETKQGGTESFEKSTEKENCATVGFSLVEDGDDDALSVDVFQAPDGFGPIFYTRAGQTTCPYEGEKKTKYFEPGKHTLAQATMQIEMPKLYVGDNNAKAQKNIDVPSGSASNFSLKLNNLSETNEDVWFMMYVVDQTNPYGAALTIDGVPFSTSRQVLVNALETTTKNLQIKQTRSDIMKYDSIAVVLASNCQYDGTDIWEVIADTVYLSVEFVPSCSPLTLEIDERTMNSSTGDTLQLVVKDFEKDYLNFSEVRLQYKGERDNDWNLAKKMSVDELSGASQTISFPMSSNLFNDQTFQFRAQSVCANGASSIITRESEVIDVIKDMARPQVLGNPNPADGILDAGDEISVTFNENIRNSVLSKSDNFVVEAVLNDAEVDHNVALKMDSTSSFAAATEANIVLANKNFAIDMWVNLASGGTLLSHKTSKENFTVSVGSTGKLTVNVNGTKVTSSDKIPFNKWCFLTLCYTAGEEASTVSSLVAYDDETVKLLVEKEVPSYGGTAAISLGKNIRGAISEMALWGTNRANTVAQSQMHFAKAPSTENLIGYWKFDEGHGKVARDAARSRNMALTDDSWYLNNTNYAATLDGKSSMALDITKSAPLSSDDYMVEMWFRGKSQQNATLWSANSSVALKFDANGMLTLMADSVDTQLSTVNYLDGAWHHVSLNVLRNGTTSAYVDGSLVKQIASSKVPALASSELTIGAQRYSNDGGTTFNYKDYFKGDVDEVRFWIATFNAKAIDQFRYMRLNGDEAGLVAYYPFEETTVDAGISMLEFSAKDMSVNAAGKAKGTAKQASTAPALQAKPNMSKLNYSFVASERTIVINLNENANRLEGTTVNFTVKNVRDENNNYSLPVVWSAYVNRNRLVWSDDAISMEKNSEEETSFEVAIANQGAATESWVISNLPTWLTASKTSGALNAQKSEAITFEVSDATPAGTYEETIYLTGNEGISVPFTLNLKVNAGKPDWSVDPAQFENSMSIIAQVKMNGEYSQDAEDLVAAFVNGNCVGVASPVYYARYDAYFVSLNVYGNQTESGKNVVFKAWDASTGVTYPALTSSQNIKFSANKLYGSMSEPVLLETNAQQEQTLGLKSGWNWISLNVTPSDNSINGTFGDVSSSANLVKGKSFFATSDGSQFQGSLAKASVGVMYKVSMKDAADLHVAGTAVDASKAKVTIKKGWNWIGFNSTSNMSLNDAFAGLSPVDGDMVKSQSDFAYYEGYEWVGTLTSLTPGKGYMYYSVASDARTFTYPAKSASLKSLVSKEPTKATEYTSVDDTKYAGNMTIVARVMNGHSIVESAEVGVFASDECRAASAVQDNSLVFLTIAGDNAGDKLIFKVIFGGVEYVIDQDLSYTEDAALGTGTNPYIIQLDPVNSVEDAMTSDILVYPTLAESELNVEAVSIVILDAQLSDISGRVLFEVVINGRQAVINVSDLKQGAYLLILNTTEGQMVQRFTKK